VGGKGEIAAFRQCLQALLERGVFGEGNACPARATGRVVMVLVKGFAEFQPVFPASGYADDDVKILENFAGSVHAGAVNTWTGGDKFGHGKAFVVLKGIKHCLARLGEAEFVRSQKLFKYVLAAHAAILAKIATLLQKNSAAVTLQP